MKSMQLGFTMIELMLAMAVVGIITSLAIPIFQDYFARSQIVEAFYSVSAIKHTITEYGISQGVYPGASTMPRNTDISVTGRYGSATVDADTGTVRFVFYGAGRVSRDIAGQSVVFIPPPLNTLSNSSGFKWDCRTSTTVPARLLPKSCS